MIFDDRFFTHVASEAGVTPEMLGPAGNICWRMKTPALHSTYRQLVDLPDCMPPFYRGSAVGGDPVLRMHPIIGRDDEETARITYVSQWGHGRFWIEMDSIPATYLNAIGSLRGRPITAIVGHPALEGCIINKICEVGTSLMVGFVHDWKSVEA